MIRRVLLMCCVPGACWLGLLAQNTSEQYLLAAANQARSAHGLAPLRLDEQLGRAAKTHADQMADHRTISHQFEGERDLVARASDSGARFSRLAENVGEASDVAEIHDKWLASEGHRENLLDPQADSVGIAVVQRGPQLYAVEDFARNVVQLSIAQQEAKIGAILRAEGVRVDMNNADARHTCSMSIGYAGSRQPGLLIRFSAASLDRLPSSLTSRMESDQYRVAQVGACVTGKQSPFSEYHLTVMLWP